MTLPDLVQRKEDDLRELVLILFTLYDGGLIDDSRFAELSENLFASAAADIEALVSREAARRGLPPVDPAILEPIVNQSLRDLQAEASDMPEVSPDQIKTRVEETAAYLAWSVFAESQRSVAEQSGGRLQWHTENDSKVCGICAPRHLRIYTPEDLPELPAHQNCRCWTEIIQ